MTIIPIPLLQAYGITSITTTYRYVHKRSHLCSKNKLILSENGHKQLSHKRETEFFWGDDGSYPKKVPDII